MNFAKNVRITGVYLGGLKVAVLVHWSHDSNSRLASGILALTLALEVQVGMA